MITTAISAASRPYSIAVAPDSSFQRDLPKFRTWSLQLLLTPLLVLVAGPHDEQYEPFLILSNQFYLDLFRLCSL